MMRLTRQKRNFLSKQLVLLTLVLLQICSQPIQAEDVIELPTLGNSAAGLLSPAQEKALGQAWLRQFRASIALDDDPITYDYLNTLLAQLAVYSELEDKSLDLVIVANNTINAFAVPGGVVGVNTGLLTAAKTEGQLASVLTHELAHISQRHFARSVEAAQRSSITTIAAMLAGIAIAASGNADLGTAAIVSGQAAALDSRLRYSRRHEREADRIGTKTLVASGYNPIAAAEMFEQMQQASRLYGRRIPEFLLTHPITESRIADARNRARNLKEDTDQHRYNREPTLINDSLNFRIVQARIQAESFETSKQAVTYYQHLVDNMNDTPSFAEAQRRKKQKNTGNITALANQYGLAISLLANKKPLDALQQAQGLIKQKPDNIVFSILKAEIHQALGEHQRSINKLSELYKLNPQNFAIGMALAETYSKAGHFSPARAVLEQLAAANPNQTNVWYLLAEAHGLEGNTLNLHISRAHYFQLVGAFGQARKHLEYAKNLAAGNYPVLAKINQRKKNLDSIEAFLANM